MNENIFQQSLDTVLSGGRHQKGIGTMGEKTLHAVLKQYLEPYAENQEIKVGRYVADILGEEGIVEIQTTGFNKIRSKLTALLDVCRVTVVYPIARTKWLMWVDPDTGEVTQKRKSPKQGQFSDAFYELYKIKMLLHHPNLRVRLMLLDMDEYRTLNGWSHDRKRGSSRYERIPIALVKEFTLTCPEDYLTLMPPDLPPAFHSKIYAKLGRMPVVRAQTALNILRHMAVIRLVGKEGRLHLYETATADE